MCRRDVSRCFFLYCHNLLMGAGFVGKRIQAKKQEIPTLEFKCAQTVKIWLNLYLKVSNICEN